MAAAHTAGKGYDRRLLFALESARADGLDGVVATVDQDKSSGRQRLQSMEAARAKDRERSAPLPAALACAVPHAEAWLLDDEVAVRTVLKLQSKVRIPNVRKTKSPKNELTGLHSKSPRAGEPVLPILAEIAAALDPGRCQHRKETGFAHLEGEVSAEIGPLTRR